MKEDGCKDTRRRGEEQTERKKYTWIDRESKKYEEMIEKYKQKDREGQREREREREREITKKE